MGLTISLLSEWAQQVAIIIPKLQIHRGPEGSGTCWLPQVLRQRQEGEAAALRTVQKLQDERRRLQEHLGSLQRSLAQLEAEKREVERSALSLEKDRVALKRMLDKVGCTPRALPHLPLCPSHSWSQLCVPRA